MFQQTTGLTVDELTPLSHVAIIHSSMQLM
jgi:hypothetical protein